MPGSILWIGVLITVSASVAILLLRDWRIILGLLAVQYVGMFLLVLSHWPLGMSAAKLITGWMSVVILAMTQSGLPNYASQEGSWPEGRAFRIFISALVLIAVASLTPNLLIWLPGITLPVAIGGLFLVGMGLLQLGITIQPLRVTIGLLTLLSGFEILYASIENSVLVAALLSVVNLGLALVGAYLINAEQIERSSEDNP